MRPPILRSLVLVGALGIGASCLPIPEPPPLPDDTLPAELTDEEFWEMVDGFSEPGGSFPYENFVSNEVAYQSVIEELTERVQADGVYLGVASEQNFTYIAALRSKLAFIVDIRRQNMLEHLMYKALFEISPDRAEFVSRLFSRRAARETDRSASAEELFAAFEGTRTDDGFHDDTLDRLTSRLVVDRGLPLSTGDLQSIAVVLEVFARGGPGLDYTFDSASPGGSMPSYYRLMTAAPLWGRNRAYLADEDAYAYVREMHRKNLIVPLVGDFAGPRTLKAVASYLENHGAIVTAFYISNVENYLDRSWPGYRSNLVALPIDDASQFIQFIPRRMLLRPMSDIPERWPGRNW